jgi:uncharacterized delta-60 repeat protein
MKNALSIFGALVCTLPAWAQVGSIDPSFNPGAGFGVGALQERVECLEQQPDGKLLIGGWFTDYNGTPANCIVRINLDGSIDNSFNTGTGCEGVFPYVNAIAVQGNGRIIVGGNFNDFDGVSKNRLVRLNANGSIDESFDVLTGFNSDVNDLAIQTDGKIIATGIFSQYDWLSGSAIPRSGIIRLNADGSNDDTFNPGAGFASTSGQMRVNCVAIQPDGKILTAGQFTAFDGEPRVLVARLNSDGSLDSSFDAGDGFALNFGFYGEVSAMELLPDGKIMLAGNFMHNGANGSGLIRLNSDGSIDNTFTATDYGTAMTVQTDGKVIISALGPYFIRRYNSDGSLDTSFEVTELNDWAQDILVQFDGNILLGGWFDYNPNAIMRVIGDSPWVGMDELSALSFNVFPNPASDFIRIDASHVARHPVAMIQVYNHLGQVIHTEALVSDQLLISCAAWPAGTYFIHAVGTKTPYTQKVIVH